MTANFYRAFEDKYRGAPDLIKERLRIYLPFVEHLTKLRSNCYAVDLGCGRGEWLDLLKEHGVDAIGVDLDEYMLARCRELGLAVSVGDAVAYLSDLPDESQDIISGFHIAEHIPFAQLQLLVSEALRVLRPAGLLILETPNPENIAVGTEQFYLDPTHNKPIPAQLLDFLPDHYGYYRTKILRLQESEGLMSEREPTILDVINGVSPDYAVIAQKKADDTILEKFDPLFQRGYGLSLETVAMRYEINNQQNLSLALQHATESIRHSEVRASAAEIDAEQQRQLLIEVEGQLSATEGQLSATEGQLSATEGQLQQANLQLQSIYTSRSWRITVPLRMAAQAVRWVRRFAGLHSSTAPSTAPSVVKYHHCPENLNAHAQQIYAELHDVNGDQSRETEH